jgi:hypothetical protein
MWFWIVVLFGWLLVEWIRRRQAERKDDERFARLVGALNGAEAELKKLTARVQTLEAHPAAPADSAATSSAVESPKPPVAKPVPAAPAPAPPVVPPEPSATKPIAPVVAPPSVIPPPITPHQSPKPASTTLPSQHVPVPPAAAASAPPRIPFASAPVAAPPELARRRATGVAIALLFAAQAFAFSVRTRKVKSGAPAVDRPWEILARRPEQVFFFAPLLLLTILLAHDVASGRVTMAWGVEAFVVFVFALLAGERSFRLTGLGLLLLCVAKILLIDVWRQERSDRFVTFITLGIALLVVSFLYSRYSEAIKRYL